MSTSEVRALENTAHEQCKKGRANAAGHRTLLWGRVHQGGVLKSLLKYKREGGPQKKKKNWGAITPRRDFSGPTPGKPWGEGEEKILINQRRS